MQDPHTLSEPDLPAPSKPVFFWKQRGLSFKYAWKGMRFAFKTQRNMWLHSAAALLAILLGILVHISAIQWVIVLLCTALVISLEIINTAIEILADRLHPGWDAQIGMVKDLAAAAVLVAAAISFVIGCWIFGPGLIRLLG